MNFNAWFDMILDSPEMGWLEFELTQKPSPNKVEVEVRFPEEYIHIPDEPENPHLMS